MVDDKNIGLSFELLLDYVEGLVDADTRQHIEALLAEDEDYQNVEAGIRFYYENYGDDRRQLEQYLEQFKNQLMREQLPSKTRRLNTRFLSIAATVLGLVLAVFLLRNQLTSQSSDRMVTAQLEPPYANLYATSRGNDTASLRNQASQAYDNQDFQAVIDELEELIEHEQTAGATDFFMLGQSYLNLESPDFGRAQELFQMVLDDNPPRSLIQQTQWYLALSQYQNGQKTAAKDGFEKIANDPSHYRQAAAQRMIKQWKN